MKSTICSECNIDTGERKKRHKHIWMYSSFCDTCNCDDFEAWLHEEKDKVVRQLVLGDFNRILCKMSIDEGKIDKQVLLEIYTKIRELARAKGFLKLPWEKQQEEDEGVTNDC